MSKNLFVIFLIMLLFGSAVRLININQPFLEYNATRQVETAMIVRNFAFNGFNFLYPEIDDNGKGPSYLIQEFPLITAPLAIICFFMGKVPEWLLRSSSLVFFILAAIFFYQFVKRYFSDRIALLSSSIFIFSPLSILMSRTFQPDMAMVFFVIFCFYCLLRWQEKMSWPYLLSAIIGFAGAVLLKITNLYIVIPVLFLVLTYEKKNDIRYWLKICLFFLISFIPIWLWWGYHVTKVRTIFSIPQTSTFSAKYILSSIKFFLTYPPFYAEIFKHITLAALTPFIFIVFIYGVFCKKQYTRADNFIYAWLFSVILFFITVPEQSKQEYYMLSLIPAASIFAANGIFSLFEKNRNSRLLKPAIAVFITLTIFFIARITIPKYINRTIYADIVEAGRETDKLTDKNAVVIASHGYGPDLLYYCNRKGWSFSIDRRELKKYYDTVKTSIYNNIAQGVIDPINELESLRKNGAAYFVIVNTVDSKMHPEFSNYLSRHYKCVKKKDNSYLIFDLRRNVS